MVKLAVIIDGENPQLFSFNSKMAARVMERFIKDNNPYAHVVSTIIYEGNE